MTVLEATALIVWILVGVAGIGVYTLLALIGPPADVLAMFGVTCKGRHCRHEERT
jgi:hypothetical protein